MRLFFVTTDHFETKIWFRDDDDFKVGMNYVAVTVAAVGVRVIAFILMSTHVHFLLACYEKDARRFISYFKQLYGTYYRNKYGSSRLFRRNSVDIQEIINEGEGIEKVIAYIIMNSVAARICATASGYRWGSGACYFNDNKEIGKPIGGLSGRERIATLKSKTSVPDNWTIGAGGYILPESYIPVEDVERLFKNARRFNYFLFSSSKAKKAKEQNGPSFRDQVILEGLNDLRVTLFNNKHLDDFKEEEKAELIRQLQWRFSADSHQISRLIGLPYSEVTELLNRL
ncbi:MAG: hypothetical protein J5759_05940 [Bacteroidales bacterium]|nr:hypothetical protein [Bacteroidales bacterium]